jgi:hypothetical protein
MGELADELRTLRKGGGIHAAQIVDRAGPALRRRCAIRDDDSVADIRRKVASWLRGAIDGLPMDLREPMNAAFALDADAVGSLFKQRIERLAVRTGQSDRTLRRRIDLGIDRLTEDDLPVAGHRDPRPGWHTSELTVLVNLELPVPEVFEIRRVVADRDRLGAVDLAFTVIAPPGSPVHDGHADFDIDVFGGGVLTTVRRHTRDRMGYLVDLPKLLRQNEYHDITVRYRLRAGAAFAPHYACVPMGRCDLLRLRVRFDRARPPAAVWQVDGILQRDLDDMLTSGRECAPDAAGEVDAEFRDLGVGLSYGFRWAPAPT